MAIGDSCHAVGKKRRPGVLDVSSGSSWLGALSDTSRPEPSPANMVVSGDTNTNTLNTGLFPSEDDEGRSPHSLSPGAIVQCRHGINRTSGCCSARQRAASRRRRACAHAHVSPPGSASRSVRPGVHSSPRARAVATAAPRPAAHRRHTPCLDHSTQVLILKLSLICRDPAVPSLYRTHVLE